MLTKIIPEKCIACGLCQVKAPDIFDYTPDGIVIFSQTSESSYNVPKSLEDQCLEAYKKCPTRAIMIEKDQKHTFA